MHNIRFSRGINWGNLIGMNDSTPKKKWGVLLIQVGTPDAPDLPSVKKFLESFLMDPEVITLSWPVRWLLVKGYIVPRRAAHSAQLYRSIFTPEGSPLKWSLRALASSLAAGMPHALYTVRHALRHGSPSSPQALGELLAEEIEGVTLIPLFPQGASSTTASAVGACYKWIKRACPGLLVRSIGPFYDHPLYIGALSARVAAFAPHIKESHLLCSYHSLPLSHLKKGAPCGCHLHPQAGCTHEGCYHAQCLATTRLLAASLGVKGDMVHHAYQSQMGRVARWLGPSTHEEVVRLAANAVKDLIVVCPGFLNGCLETIDEIGVRARHAFLAAGGSTFVLIPALDDDPAFSALLSAMVEASVPPRRHQP